jgi:hypothetical protein
MSLTVVEQFDIGCGVDSRSNPLNMPRNRALRMRNFAPKDSGVLELRWGFSTVTMSTTTATAFHSLIPYTLYDNSGSETPYIIMGQGLNLSVMNIASSAVSTPSLRGAALASTASFNSYLANGKIHLGNGTDQKWFDGTTFRDNGLRTLTAAEYSPIAVYAGLADFSAASLSTMTLAQTSSGGNFSTQSQGGMYFYTPIFNTDNNELGPSPNFVSSGRIQISAASSKVTIANMPVTPTNWKKLIARTGDGTAPAYFCTTASTVSISTVTRSGQTITVTTSSAHGRSTNDIVIITGSSEPLYNVPWVITVTAGNTFTMTTQYSIGSTSATGGTVAPILFIAGATTTVDVTLTSRDTSFVVNDGNRGIPASSVGGSSPGYQFYAAIANPNGGGHVGNRVAIGNRIVPTRRTNVFIVLLPNLAATDSEWEVQIGRTGDGAQLPYACADSSGNFLYALSGQTTVLVNNHGNVDGSQELPVRNGVIPSGLNMFARVSDTIYGGQVGRPTIYWSASESGALTGDYVGRPEQSWAADNIDTFPTSQGLTGMFAEDRGAFYGTKNDGAIYADLGNGKGWLGPWYGAGLAGTKAWCDTPYGKFWVTGHKQLVMFEQGIPAPVSEEYQQALLSKIGDSFLSFTEAQHIQDIAKSIDHILIKCRDSNGNPFEVIHDFRLRDGRSQDGQAYELAYSAPLATNFVLSKVRDSSGAERLWAGASTGQLYQLHSGANDAGTEYSADAIFLLNAGPDRLGIPELRWYGDQKAIISRGEKLKSSVATGSQFAFEQVTPSSGGLAVDGDQDDYHFKTLAMSSEGLKHVFIRLQLASHSADGTLALNDPPHVPLENYGRIYATQALVGKAQGA